MKNRNTISTTILLALACFALCPAAQAVSPAPDGGYPGANTAEGQNALLSLTTGTYNTAVGLLSLRSDTTGSFNTAIGAGALLANIGGQNGAGSQNTATGFGALLSNTIGGSNTANGALALFSNSIGFGNTAIGAGSLQANTASYNTANGVQALLSNTTGNDNTANGYGALINNSTGNQNTANGSTALFNNTTGNGNIALGFNAGHLVQTANNVICIGSPGNNVDNSCYIGNIFTTTLSGGTPVYVNSNGRLGTATSSQRFKERIKPMDKASEALFALKPVTFRYKKDLDPEGIPQFGLVAEEVEKVNPDLVVRDEKGKPYSVHYDQVNAMLLNEFLKEHKKVRKLEAALGAVNQRLQAQDAKIDRVNAKIELSRPPPQVALSNP